MNILFPMLIAAVLASGCASTTKKELSRIESEGPGIWQMHVKDFPGEIMTGFLIWRHDKEQLADDEHLVVVASSAAPLLLSSPFKNLVTMLTKAKRSLGLGVGDIVTVDNPFRHKNTKYIPDIGTVLCKKADANCIDRTTLGLKTQNGEVTVGPYIWVPF